MNEEPDVTEVVDAVERLCRNYRKPLLGRESPEQTDNPREDVGIRPLGAASIPPTSNGHALRQRW
jgi:hypothetical protein